MTTLYYAIRYREPFEVLDVKLNFELEKTQHASEMTRFASKIQNISFDNNPAIMESVIDEIDQHQFIGIPQPYLRNQVLDPNNNLLVLFTLINKEIQVECVVAYHQIELSIRGKKETSIEIPAISVIDLPKRDLHLSGSDIMKWFYQKVKDVGGYSIEIDAIGSAMKFWHEKMKFSWKRLNPHGKRATIIKEIKRKRHMQKTRKTKIPEEEIDNLYYHIPNAPMHRTRSDRSLRSNQSSETNSAKESPMMLSLHELQQLHNDDLIDHVEPVPTVIMRYNSTGHINKMRKTAKKRAHSK